jgi:microcystin-dependent protein
MATKPDLIKWVPSDDVAKVVDPGATKKSNGFLYLERPPAQFFNYLFNIAFKWYRGLQGKYAQIVVGSSSQKAANDATHVIGDLSNVVVTAGMRVTFLEGTHTLAANLSLSANNIIVECENGGAIIDLGGANKLTFSGTSVRVDINVSNPNTGATDNITVSGAGSLVVVAGCDVANLTIGPTVRIIGPNSVWSTGDVKTTLKTAADPGWLMMNDGTIGDASSGASARANADCLALFKLLWTNTANADCPVSTGRGANAAADFAAHKTIALPKALGRALAIAGTGSGLSARALAAALGEETHTLTQLESTLKNHTHSINDPSHVHAQTGFDTGGSGPGQQARGQFNSSLVSSFDTLASTTGISINATSDASANPHNNMQPTTFLNIMVKL